MKILNRTFSWGFSGFLTLSFYVLGSACWWVARANSHYEILYTSAAGLFLIGFLSSLRWLWKNKFFRRSRKHSRRYSDQQAYPHSDLQSHAYAEANVDRRGQGGVSRRKLRWAAISLSTLFFAAVMGWLFVSYRFRLALEEVPQIEISIIDKVRTRAQSVPFIKSTDAVKEMDFAMRDVPTRAVSVSKDAKSVTINVVVRNLGNADILSPHLMIDSDIPIKAWGMNQFSDTEIASVLSTLQAFKQSSDDQVIAVEISIPPDKDNARAGLLVSMEGDNMRPYAAAVNVLLVKKP